MTQTLAELDSELQSLFQYLDSDIPEDRAMAESLLAELVPQLETKIDGYMGVISHFADVAGNIVGAASRNENREIDRLKQRKVSVLAKHDYLKSRLQTFLEDRVAELGDRGKKLEGNLYRVTLNHNGGKIPVRLNDQIGIDRVPPEFIETTVTQRINTDKLRAYLEQQESQQLLTVTGEIIAQIMPRGRHIRIS
jgi:hypothetical protein